VKICVVISLVNRPQVLHETVLSVLKQTIAPNFVAMLWHWRMRHN
jgi:hypothetical protein